VTAQIKLSRENRKKRNEKNYRRLIDFLSQISKLSHFNLLGLADFLMHLSRFVFWCGIPGCALMQLHTCGCNIYVHHFELRH